MLIVEKKIEKINIVCKIAVKISCSVYKTVKYQLNNVIWKYFTLNIIIQLT